MCLIQIQQCPKVRLAARNCHEELLRKDSYESLLVPAISSLRSFDIAWLRISASGSRLLLLPQPACRQLLCCLQRIRGLHFYIRLHARSFPVGSRDRIDHLYPWNTDQEVIVDSMRHSYMPATRARLAHNHGAFEHLQVVAKHLGGGETPG